MSVAAITMSIALAATLGILLGQIRYRGIGLGIAGVLFAGIAVGHYSNLWLGLEIRTAEGYTEAGSILHYVQEFGLILFVYAIGVQVGPGFFSSLRTMGAKLIMWVLVIIFMGCAIALTLYFTGVVSLDAMIGMYAGAITNTPALGAGSAMIKDVSPLFEQAGLGSLSDLVVPSAYAMAYPFAVCSLLITMIALRLIFRIDIEREGESYKESRSGGLPSLSEVNVEVVNENYDERKVCDLEMLRRFKIIISRVLRGGEVTVPNGDFVLKCGDIIHMVGAEDGLSLTAEAMGRRVEDRFEKAKENREILVRRMIVTSKKAIGHSLESLGLRAHETVVSRVYRAGVQFSPSPNLRLFFGDALTVVGPQSGIETAKRLVGDSGAALNKVQMLPLFLGILIGIVVGLIPIPIPGVPSPLRLGIAGGPLVVAILLSRFGSELTHGVMHWDMPVAGLAALREIGITLFLTIVGISAGASGFWETLTNGPGLYWMGWAALISIIPLLVVGFIAYKVSHINYLVLCGALAGSYTDPPALAFANGIHSDPEATSIGYATVYPVTMFLRILSPQIMIIIVMLAEGI